MPANLMEIVPKQGNSQERARNRVYSGHIVDRGGDLITSTGEVTANAMTKRKTSRYIRGFTLPRSIPEGRMLCHNHVAHGPFTPCGLNGFRAWTDTEVPDGFVKCSCGYAGLPHYAHRSHVKFYRKDGKLKATGKVSRSATWKDCAASGILWLTPQTPGLVMRPIRPILPNLARPKKSK